MDHDTNETMFQIIRGLNAILHEASQKRLLLISQIGADNAEAIHQLTVARNALCDAITAVESVNAENR